MLSPNKKRILVIHDDPMTVRLVELALKGNGYEIHSASNGREGIQKALSLKPALAILDGKMSGDLDGYEVCRFLKAVPATAATKILMFADQNERRGALMLPGNKGEGRMLGLDMEADAFLGKPIRIKELIEGVQTLLQAEVTL